MLNIFSISTFAIVSADLLGIGVRMAKRVRWSIIVSTYLQYVPVRDLERVLYSTRSTDIRSKGRWTGT